MDWALLLLCLQIFLLRIFDVSLGTTRMLLTVKEKTVPAALIGFVEVMVWFLGVRQALTSDSGILAGVAYAAGFATGTLIGGQISKRFIKGNLMVQIVTHKDDDIASEIRAAGFGLSVVNVNSSDFGDEKHMFFCEIDKARMPELRKLVHAHDKDAFIMVQDTKHVFNGFIK